MIPWDAIITFAIIAVAAFYIVRKFTKAKKGGSCGCSSDNGCCGGSNHGSSSSPCDGSLHR